MGSLESEKIIIGSLESEKIGPLGSEIGSLQIHTGYLTFSLKKNCVSLTLTHTVFCKFERNTCSTQAIVCFCCEMWYNSQLKTATHTHKMIQTK